MSEFESRLKGMLRSLRATMERGAASRSPLPPGLMAKKAISNALIPDLCLALNRAARGRYFPAIFSAHRAAGLLPAVAVQASRGWGRTVPVTRRHEERFAISTGEIDEDSCRRLRRFLAPASFPLLAEIEKDLRSTLTRGAGSLWLGLTQDTEQAWYRTTVIEPLSGIPVTATIPDRPAPGAPVIVTLSVRWGVAFGLAERLERGT